MGEHFAPISRERYTELLEAEQRLATAEQERDKAQALVQAYQVEQRRQAAILDPKIERWAALETAARAFVARGAAPGGPQTAQAFVALFEALAALDPPAGEAG